MNKEIFICAFNNRRAAIIYNMLHATIRRLHIISRHPYAGHYEVEMPNVRITIGTWNDDIRGKKYDEVFYDGRVPMSYIHRLRLCAHNGVVIPLVSLDLLFDFE